MGCCRRDARRWDAGRWDAAVGMLQVGCCRWDPGGWDAAGPDVDCKCSALREMKESVSGIPGTFLSGNLPLSIKAIHDNTTSDISVTHAQNLGTHI